MTIDHKTLNGFVESIVTEEALVWIEGMNPLKIVVNGLAGVKLLAVGRDFASVNSNELCSSKRQARRCAEKRCKAVCNKIKQCERSPCNHRGRNWSTSQHVKPFENIHGIFGLTKVEHTVISMNFYTEKMIEESDLWPFKVNMIRSSNETEVPARLNWNNTLDFTDAHVRSLAATQRFRAVLQCST
ncbi:uncharacterized protein G2W53_040886 [Senna tora]|uniref:Uncharacterized protein n=1 Tax=Senna tora TaxID=362788 RepID=A0A834SCX2_9FABA|nr:uncharacterized protein G2W53_040886 [Senna tora]